MGSCLEPSHSKGAIHLLGCGIAIPSQMDRLSEAVLAHADSVFHLLSGPVEVEWIAKFRPDAVSLIPIYEHHPDDRLQVYAEMAETVVSQAGVNHSVALLQYGHPTLGSTVTAIVLNKATERGTIAVRVYPAISSVDCLIADIGLDPNASGLQTMDATLLVRYPDRYTPSIPLVLLQIGLTGFDGVPGPHSTQAPGLAALMEILGARYGHEHMVLLYEASAHVSFAPRMDWVRLSELESCVLNVATTLFVPPCRL